MIISGVDPRFVRKKKRGGRNKCLNWSTSICTSSFGLLWIYPCTLTSTSDHTKINISNTGMTYNHGKRLTHFIQEINIIFFCSQLQCRAKSCYQKSCQIPQHWAGKDFDESENLCFLLSLPFHFSVVTIGVVYNKFHQVCQLPIIFSHDCRSC